MLSVKRQHGRNGSVGRPYANGLGENMDLRAESDDRINSSGPLAFREIRRTIARQLIRPDGKGAVELHQILL